MPNNFPCDDVPDVLSGVPRGDRKDDARCNIDDLPESDIRAEFDQDRTPCSVRNRLKKNLQFLKNIGSFRWVLDIIDQGYYLPLIEEPKMKFFKNHSSTVQHADFVEEAILKLEDSGSINK